MKDGKEIHVDGEAKKEEPAILYYLLVDKLPCRFRSLTSCARGTFLGFYEAGGCCIAMVRGLRFEACFSGKDAKIIITEKNVNQGSPCTVPQSLFVAPAENDGINPKKDGSGLFFRREKVEDFVSGSSSSVAIAGAPA